MGSDAKTGKRREVVVTAIDEPAAKKIALASGVVAKRIEPADPPRGSATQWKILGARAADGKDVSTIIAANTSDIAEAIARSDGILVSTVLPVPTPSLPYARKTPGQRSPRLIWGGAIAIAVVVLCIAISVAPPKFTAPAPTPIAVSPMPTAPPAVRDITKIDDTDRTSLTPLNDALTRLKIAVETGTSRDRYLELLQEAKFQSGKTENIHLSLPAISCSFTASMAIIDFESAGRDWMAIAQSESKGERESLNRSMQRNWQSAQDNVAKFQLEMGYVK